MKILPCNRCQHYIHSEREPSAFSQCGHPDTQKIDFVTGQTNPMFCTTVRALHGRCGPEGKLWAYDDAFPPSEECETIVWNKLTEADPPEEIGLLLYYKGEVFWGDWDGEAFRDAYTGLVESADYWAVVKGPQ